MYPQGRFKRPVAAADLMMGQEFVKASQAPPWVAEMVFTAAARTMSNSTQVRAVDPNSSIGSRESCTTADTCFPGLRQQHKTTATCMRASPGVAEIV